MVVTTGLEPVTTSMSRKHSTTELRDHTLFVEQNSTSLKLKKYFDFCEISEKKNIS